MGNAKYLEPVANTNNEWYWTMGYDSGFDAYDAGLNFCKNKAIEGTNMYIVHYPDGEKIQLLKKEKNIHTSIPFGYKDHIYFTRIEFDKRLINIMKYNSHNQIITLDSTIPLKSIKNCYNMFFHCEPLMLTCNQGRDFKILWPEKKKYKINYNESFIYRRGNKLVFEKENDDYEDIIIRDYHSGKVVEKTKKTGIQMMPNGDKWFIKFK